ncbi:MAG: guanine permease, partial [Ignavibacteriales bacterium CG_4_9_14_3_um_filter_34_10]
IIPSFAYGSALIVVGILMISPISKLNFTNLSDAVPSFVTIILMSFTYNIAIGMTAGFIILPLTYLISGRKNEISSGLLILFLLSILFYAFFPY